MASWSYVSIIKYVMLILFSLTRMKIITSTSFSLKNNKFYATKSSTGSRNTSKVAEIVYPKATDSLDQLFMGKEKKAKNYV